MTSTRPIHAPSLLVTVFVIGTCGLIYELLAGTLASYVLGDSVTQFSTIIGVYLFAMGVGSWLSRFITRDVVARFIEIEVAVALIGGSSAALLYLAFARLSFFAVVLYGLVFIIGTLVGLEIPLLMRILKDRYELKELVSRVLTFDYLGALVASLAFPLFVVPRLGLVRGSFVVGCLNGAVALWCTHVLAAAIPRHRRVWFLRAEASLTLSILLTGLVFSEQLTSLAEDSLYTDPIITAKTTPYQRLVVTQGRGGFSLYINGALQFTSSDEHRYHESLVHPAMAILAARGVKPRRVLVLGGGDGLAVREILKHSGVEEVTLVDLDAEMTNLGRTHPLFVHQNRGAFADARVRIVNDDAMTWLDGGRKVESSLYDAVYADFPDPSSFSVGKLYTTRFYRLLKRVLSPEGVLTVQATSPVYARRSFWCVAETLEEVGFSVRPFHASVPSFGEWGYVLAAPHPFEVPSSLPDVPLRYLTPAVMRGMFEFGRDADRIDAEVNRLNDQILVRYYEEEWSRWN